MTGLGRLLLRSTAPGLYSRKTRPGPRPPRARIHRDGPWVAHALPTAVGANLSGLADPATRPQAIEIIKQRVGDNVRSAISEALSWELKILIGTGAYQLDFVIGSDFYVSPDLTAADFTLSMSDTSGNSYAVHGGLRVHVPAVDACQAQADQVTAKQKNVDGINDQISRLRGGCKLLLPPRSLIRRPDPAGQRRPGDSSAGLG
jgi:hypothetical protein